MNLGASSEMAKLSPSQTDIILFFYRFECLRWYTQR